MHVVMIHWFSLFFSAWCLRSEGVSSVLLGVSTADQLLENLGALRVLTTVFLPSLQFPPTSIKLPDTHAALLKSHI